MSKLQWQSQRLPWERPGLLMLALVLLACGSSTGTTPSPTPTGPQHATLYVNGQERYYDLVSPPNRKGSLPLVLALHGYGGSAVGLESNSRLGDEAIKDGFLVVFPQGIAQSWNAGTCCGAAQSQNVDDVAFIRQLIDRVEHDYRIDAKRVFVTGLSNGAVMAYRVGCEIPDRVLAIASVSGTMGIADCHPSRPISVLEMHGTDDTSIPYAGGVDDAGVTDPAVETVIKDWAARDGCVGTPSQTQSGITKTSLWSTCNAGTTVRLDAVVGGHHTWFGSPIDPVPGEPDATAVIWAFFSHLNVRS